MSELILRTASHNTDQYEEAIEFLNEKINSYKSVGHLASDSDFVYKAAELIRQLSESQFSLTDPTDMFFTRRTGPALGDWVEIEEYVNTSKVVQRSLGGKPRVYTPHKKKYTFAMEDWRIDFGFELERLATRQIDVRVWVEQMAESISRFYVTEALDTVDAAVLVGTTDAYSRSCRTQVATNVDSDTIDTALRRLGDINSDVVIAGRYYALYPLFKLTGYSDVALEEFRQRGAVGKFRGATVVVLRDSYNAFFGAAQIPADLIWISGAEKGGFMAETDMSSMNYEVVDQEEQHFRVGVKGRTSFNIFKPWLYHVIEIT
jgi:hypothetical protein